MFLQLSCVTNIKFATAWEHTKLVNSMGSQELSSDSLLRRGKAVQTPLGLQAVQLSLHSHSACVAFEVQMQLAVRWTLLTPA